MGRYVLFCIFLCLSSCRTAEFVSQKKPETPSKDPEKILLDIDCREEDAIKAKTLLYPLNIYEFNFQTKCPPLTVQSDAQMRSGQLNLVLVFNLSKEMHTKMATAMGNFIQLLQSLKERGWDLKVGGVGFTQRFRTFEIVSLDDPEKVKPQIGAWKVQNTTGPQAGQLALKTALNMLKDFRENNPKRTSASDQILYVSMGPVFANEVNSDFTVEDLISTTVKEKDLLNNLRMDYWVTEDAVSKSSTNISAVTQWKKFMMSSGIPGVTWDNFSNDTLLRDYNQQFVNVTTTKTGQCQVTSLAMAPKSAGSNSAENQSSTLGEVVSFNEDVASKTDVKTPFRFLFKNTTALQYVLTINRCCAQGNAAHTAEAQCPFAEARQMVLSLP